MTDKGKERDNTAPKIIKQGIVTFVQLPPSPPPFEKIEKKNKQDLNGTELFSLFTADIIKKEVLFTR